MYGYSAGMLCGMRIRYIERIIFNNKFIIIRKSFYLKWNI